MQSHLNPSRNGRRSSGPSTSHPNAIARNLTQLFAIVLLGLALGFASPTAAPTSNVGTSTSTNQCPSISLEDQFGTRHELKFPRAKPTILAIADKEGSEAIQDWAHPLGERFGDAIEIAGLADVSAVPRVLRSLVRSKFKKAITYPVMLDWSGEAVRQFDVKKGEANVVLISPSGELLQYFNGRATPEKLNELESGIRGLLPKNAQAKARSN